MPIDISELKDFTQQPQQPYTYQDLHLDIDRNDRYVGLTGRRIPGADIRVDYDELAIRNSLRNLFNTKKGQRFLFPLYGVDLYRYIFEPISEIVAQSIGEDIQSAITLFEPRVKVLKVRVIGDAENNLYEITIIVQIPTLNKTSEIYADFELKSQSFIIFNSSRNR